MKDDMRSLTNGMYALAIFVYATVLASFWGFWILGVILFAASLLLIGIIFGRYYGASL
jgi:multidrug efflux pump subunit AcrB